MAATSVVLVDMLPAGTTLDTVLTGRGSCTPAGRSVLCNLGTLAVGGSVTVTIKAFIRSDAQPGKIDNTVDVSSTEIDPDPTNNHSVETTTIRLQVAVSYSITGP